MHQLYLQSDRAGCDREIAAVFECTRVVHRDTSAGEVCGEQFHPLRQALAAALAGELDDFRIGRGEIGWCDCVRELAQHEFKPPLGVTVECSEFAQFVEETRV